MTALFAGPTIERLAQALLAADHAEARPLVELTPANGQPPFVYLHGDLLGGGYYSVELARHLGADIPFLLMPPLLVGADGGTPSIPEMAAQHIRTLRQAAPRGPYRLAGFCNSGVVAFEVARQLQAAGEAIACLVLIEAQVPSRALILLRRVVRLCGWLLRRDHDRQLRQLGAWSNRLERWRAVRGLPLAEQLRAVWGKAARLSQRAPPSAGEGGPAPAAGRDPMDVSLWSLAGYRPGHYPGAVTLITAAGTDHRREGHERWRRHCAHLTTITVPGRHLEIITTQAPVLAAALRACCLPGGAAAPAAGTASARQEPAL